MNAIDMIQKLSTNAGVIRCLMAGVLPEQARWKPEPDRWSILEVVNHLYDEEREDFRQRLNLLLHHQDQRWPAIDPEGWAVERRYNERDLGESLERFLAERQQSVAWLEGLSSPDWEASYDHPIIGPIKAGDLLVSWAMHDLLHVHQLANLHRAYLEAIAEPYSTRYAL